jgi:hypothetical protein
MSTPFQNDPSGESDEVLLAVAAAGVQRVLDLELSQQPG